MAKRKSGAGTGRQATTRRAARPAAKARAGAAKRPAAMRKPAAAKRGTVKRTLGAAKRKPRTGRAQPETLRLRAFSPGLTVNDLARSIDFYSRALGFVVSERWMRGGRLAGVMLKAGVCELGLGQDDWARGRERRKGEGFRLWCETRQDVDALAARVRAAGGKITAEPEDKPWGARAFSLDDPDGFHLTFFRELASR